MPNKPDKLILHHSGGTDADPLADTSHHTAEMIRKWHLQKGWDDIGYNWVIEKDGKTVQGRDESISGAHTIGQNSTSIGVVMTGNFDATFPTKAQEESFKKLFREINKRFPIITPDRVFPHRKYASKTCCGLHLPDDYGKNLAISATLIKKEITDNSPEAKEFLKQEAKKESRLKKLLALLKLKK